MQKKYKGIAAILLLSGIAACSPALSDSEKSVQKEPEESLKTTLLKVGKADAIILQSKGQTMVIDTGEEDDGEELTGFLKDQGISYVDALIITHFDKDHVGGADTLIETVETGEIFLPDYTGSHTEYLDFMDALEQKNIVPHMLKEAEEFELGEASVLIEPPHSYDAGDSEEPDNNFSLITTVTHGKNSLLFMGDAKKQRIREWLPERAAGGYTFLKMPHHGVYNKALPELIDSVSPEYAVICSSDKNPAESETLNLLEQMNVQTFQTKDGNVTILSDGKTLECSQ